MPFEALIATDRIVMLVDPISRDSVLDAAARLLSGSSGESTQAIADALHVRERLATTAIGRGVALPHCRSKSYAQTHGVLLRLQYPVDFSASDGEPVDLVFAMCSPSDSEAEHLQIMSALAERFSDPELREALRGASDLGAMRDALLAPRGTNSWTVGPS